MEIVMRGSEYQDFLQCRKKWFHSWVEKITPNKPDNKLFFGTLFHKWLENYYREGCNELTADLLTSMWMNEQDMSGMEQTDIDEQKALFKGVRDNYIKTYDDSAWNVLGTEVEFTVLLDDGVYFTGTIDLVYELNGKVYFADHKTVTSLDMYEEKSKMDRQISRYWWALEQIAAGVGRVKKVIMEDGKPQTLWVRWEELIGKEIEGFIYNLIAKDFPREPKVLKPKKGQTVGDLSVDKSQKTTFDKYLAKIHELGKNPEDYIDILRHLDTKPDPFLRRVNVIRTSNEKESAMWEFMYTVNDIHDTLMTLMHYPDKVEEVTYRHIGTHCDHMCQFKSICQTAIEGGNVQMVKNLAYKKNEER